MKHTELTTDEYGEEYIWTTAQGISIPLSQMTNSHLQNSINFLVRVTPTDFPMFQGEEAQAMAEQEFFAALDSNSGWQAALKAEQKRREGQTP